MPKESNTAVTISSLFILLFVYTAISKWLSFDAFRAVLAQSPLTGRIAPLIAWGLPSLELFIALLLSLRTTRKTGLYAAGILMLIFTLYVAGMLLFSPHLPCSCGGIIQAMSWKAHLVFNLAACLLLLYAMRTLRNEPIY